jgi:N-methylhydantoinase A
VRGIRVAADIGGTFTDVAFVTAKGTVVSRKVLSTPADFAAAVIQGIREILRDSGASIQSCAEIRHATTVATNAILEQKGARTALVTTEGFRDVLELRRIRIPVLYDPHYIKPRPLVPRRLRFEVPERVGAGGEVIVTLQEDRVRAVARQIKAANVDAIAVSLLHSYANAAHERRVGEILKEEIGDRFVTLSVDVLPEIREYERTSTTVINAYVGPTVGAYIVSLVRRLQDEGFAGRTLIMQSDGGMLTAEAVADKPAQIVECGPAGGVIGATFVCRRAGFPNAITLDIGGTTAKACLIEDGRYAKTAEYEVGGGMSVTSQMFKGKGHALKFPVIDISEVGTGGGSIARLDQAGVLKVGPDSAGANPGPACYGQGGDSPTLTDANVVLGYLNQKALAGGTMLIDASRSRTAIERHIARPLRRSVSDAAHGIHAVANANMMRAIKSVSTYRGRDPREFTLFAFGGNGGAHAAGLAEALGMRRVVVPPVAGVFSALGMLYAQVELEHSRAFVRTLELTCMGAMAKEFEGLEQAVTRNLQYGRSHLRFSRSLDLRYRGQAYELPIDVGRIGPSPRLVRLVVDRFAAEHERTYGYRLPPDAEIEIVTLRVRGIVAARSQGEVARASLAERAKTNVRGDVREVYFGARRGHLSVPLTTRVALRGKGRRGPFLIDEYDSTIVVPPGWRGRLDRLGNIVLHHVGTGI